MKPGTTPDPTEFADVIRLVAREAAAYLDELPDRPVRSPHHEAAAKRFVEPFPEHGHGATQTLERLVRDGFDAAVGNGPRFFHFVMGGTTPASLGADWLTTVLDQVAYAWVSSPLAVQLEIVSLSWLRSLFGLPSQWGGVMTTGATMANFVGLAAARQWWGERRGVDVSEDGLSGLPPIPVFSSGHVHASAVKALAMLGIGRSSLRLLTRDNLGRLDLDALDMALRALDGSPAIIIGNAGEVNAGDFDPIGNLADMAQEFDAWLHVDGAFGLFAGLSPRTQHLVAGTERAHSVTVDGHKWLNVPYDCGFSFVSNPALLARTFTYTAAYLPKPDDPHPNMGAIGPESSRRARALSVWATLHAYGRAGYREIVEKHLALAQKLGELVTEAPDLELLAKVQINIVCFRYNDGNRTDEELNDINERLGQAILEDGRVYVGTTRFVDRVALRPAISNWRSTEGDIQMLVDVVRELGAKVAGASRRDD
jgi:glutamate/tyrosine decarboxylase-like PLP-dependent enzyme